MRVLRCFVIGFELFCCCYSVMKPSQVNACSEVSWVRYDMSRDLVFACPLLFECYSFAFLGGLISCSTYLFHVRKH